MTPARLLLLEELLAEFGDEYRPLLARTEGASTEGASTVNVTRILVTRIREREEAALATTPKRTS